MDSALARKYSSRRRAIVEALAVALETQINGSPPMRTSVSKVERRLKFWDEVNEFPTIHIGAGSETREYDGGGFRFRFLRITVRCYVSDDNDVIHASISLSFSSTSNPLFAQTAKVSAIITFLNNPIEKTNKPVAIFLWFAILFLALVNCGIISL